MSFVQGLAFLSILLCVTLRTLFFRSVASKALPKTTAWAIGSGTTCICLLLFPIAWVTGLANTDMLLNASGAIAGLTKGGLLTMLLVVQQQIIGRSVSATAYIFPIEIGAIVFLEYWLFGSQISGQGILSVLVLFIGGICFVIFGHLSFMPRIDKFRFYFMILAVIGFAGCDKVGIPASGWYVYLLYVGIGNWVSARFFIYEKFGMRFGLWVMIALGWTIPELIFNFALAGTLPVSYGYLAISMRVPLLMIVAYFLYKEGRAKSQIFFGAIAFLGTVPLFIK